jgi:DNA-binding CsgD family transcriptional regulator
LLLRRFPPIWHAKRLFTGVPYDDADASNEKRSGDPESNPRSGLMATSLRRTGLTLLGDMNWGSHVCLFYQSKTDLLDTVLPFFAAGLESNEFCLWATSEPISVQEARTSMSEAIPAFDRYLSAGQMEIIPGHEWYLQSGRFDLERTTRGWYEKLRGALAKGHEGMRISGNTAWLKPHIWKAFGEYEQDLNNSLAGREMIAMCTYPLDAARAADVLDVANAHQCTIARRNSKWEFMETPELRHAKQEITNLTQALDVLSKPFPGDELLTPRERVVLAQIVRGASSKEAGQALGVSPRTIEFHRANIMTKLGAKNIVDLLRLVLLDR